MTILEVIVLKVSVGGCLVLLFICTITNFFLKASIVTIDSCMQCIVKVLLSVDESDEVSVVLEIVNKVEDSLAYTQL